MIRSPNDRGLLSKHPRHASIHMSCDGYFSFRLFKRSKFRAFSILTGKSVLHTFELFFATNPYSPTHPVSASVQQKHVKANRTAATSSRTPRNSDRPPNFQQHREHRLPATTTNAPLAVCPTRWLTQHRHQPCASADSCRASSDISWTKIF